MHLRSGGIEPGWGFLHEPEDRKPSLSLDLLEPFRSPLCDALVLDMLNHKRFGEDDFEYKDGGFFLKRGSRRKVFLAYEQRMEREFNYEVYNYRTTLRSIIKETVQHLKKVFMERVDIVPFKMN